MTTTIEKNSCPVCGEDITRKEIQIRWYGKNRKAIQHNCVKCDWEIINVCKKRPKQRP